MGKGAATPAEVMSSVEQARAHRGLSKAELARRSRVRPETVRHLLTGGTVNPTLSSVLDMLRPLGLGLDVVPLATAPAEPTNDMLKGWLAHYGAALFGPENLDPAEVPPPETVLADALKLSRESATVARTLPLVFWETREYLDLGLLRKEGARRGQARTLGFFLDLTSRLSSDLSFERAAKKLQVRTLSRPVQFFQPTTLRERKLAELRTPEVARKWGFRMNMEMESFESMFAKGTK
jgi:transcriptional regulator with XRE-family HTH domain